MKYVPGDEMLELGTGSKVRAIRIFSFSIQIQFICIQRLTIRAEGTVGECGGSAMGKTASNHAVHLSTDRLQCADAGLPLRLTGQFLRPAGAVLRAKLLSLPILSGVFGREGLIRCKSGGIEDAVRDIVGCSSAEGEEALSSL